MGFSLAALQQKTVQEAAIVVTQNIEEFVATINLSLYKRQKATQEADRE